MQDVARRRHVLDGTMHRLSARGEPSTKGLGFGDLKSFVTQGSKNGADVLLGDLTAGSVVYI